MTVFSEAEIAYLESKTMGRLATIGADGRPHLVPLTYRFNADEDAIDIGGIDFANSKKWRDILGNPYVAFLVDDASAAAHAIASAHLHAEPIGAEHAHFSGGESINPRFPNFKPEFVRVRPHRIISWGLETEGFAPRARNVNSSGISRAATATEPCPERRRQRSRWSQRGDMMPGRSGDQTKNPVTHA